MSKMISHDPFEYLQHKLWLKKRSWIKVSIWLLTIKAKNHPKLHAWKKCAGAWHASLKNSWQRLQLCFKPHLDQRSTQEVISVQSGKSPNFGNFKTPDLGVLGKMTFGCNPHGQSHIILWKGRWWLPPNLGRGESCEFIYVHGSSMHQKCFNYALTNLLLGLCTSIWIIDLLVTCPSPHPKTPTHPRPQNVVNKRTYP
jgi:hypothetical protein